MDPKSDMFYRSNRDMADVPYPLRDEMVIDLLAKANTYIGNTTFGFAILDKPHSGYNMMFILHPDNQDECPSDGYAWIDKEVVRTVQIDAARSLVAYSRRQGVVPGTDRIAMTRTRYQLFSSNQPMQVQFMHYLAADDKTRSMPIPSNIPIATAARRIPVASYSQQPPAPAPTRVPTHQLVGGVAVPRAASARKPAANPTLISDAQYLAPPVPVTARDVAVARFKRNHDWMEAILALPPDKDAKVVEAREQEVRATTDRWTARLAAMQAQDDDGEELVVDRSGLADVVRAVDAIAAAADWDLHVARMNAADDDEVRRWRAALGLVERDRVVPYAPVQCVDVESAAASVPAEQQRVPEQPAMDVSMVEATASG
ncbi:hypothetical protein AMAG_12534 [Allomyces macrogynus ATCC 38327]|uniref:SWI/SNF and RSC complexes subunit Ssr4 N-terminal domain-containing protein n=1 Tax=Allomyces macrogynus (strain ATCC 38327) TaxID=578462 RepID=A0A0L0SZ86_ALLM3|nr:hypothetical protein AMAG_12534 [Allomyces macrogynus ATCC 38327]|eukprot:KNE67816.1 hypothetical protein AMAG_12534 [Allomyces macrogynus ATCC 38327]